MTKRDRLMLAIGILEGEGTFGVTTWRRYPTVRLGMCDPEPVHFVAKVFGWVTPRRNHSAKCKARGWKPVWNTGVAGVRARACMRQVRPFLSPRRQAQIDKALR